MTANDELKPNSGKSLLIEVDGQKYARFPVRTHVIKASDKIIEVVKRYARPHLHNGDALFISERVVAISQGRAFPISSITPSPIARLLVKFVQRSPYGIGLGSPWTMELAIREAGILRIFFAAFISAITKPFGLKGVFYKVAGKNINAIDGPCSYTLPPYDQYAKLGPSDPNGMAREIKKVTDCDVVIIDANDLGVAILGRSDRGITDDFCKKVFRDNPLGQTSEQTPLCIVRKAG